MIFLSLRQEIGDTTTDTVGKPRLVWWTIAEIGLLWVFDSIGETKCGT